LEDVTPTENAAGTGKIRRKRRKRKKKKKTSSGQSTVLRSDDGDYSSEDDDSDNFVRTIAVKNGNNDSRKNKTNKNNLIGNAPSGASNLSTPQEILRRKLIESDGYEGSQIDQAMEEMWEKGMAYDEYESVINYLQVGVCGTTASTASNSVISVSTKAEEGNEEADTTETQNRAFRLLETTHNGEDTKVLATKKSDDGGTQIENDDEEECDSVIEESTESSTNPSPSTSIMKKLDIVAGFENLTDAIFALTQWVEQAASDEEIDLFCRAEETSALPMVFRRGILYETEDNKRYEIAVQPALVGLLMAVLDRCGINSLEKKTESELVERIGNTLKHARKVSILTAEQSIIDDEAVISDRVSQFIVSRLSRAMDEVKQYNKAKNNHRDSESCNISNDSDVDMAVLISERDAMRADAKHACVSVKISMDSLFGDAANNISSNGIANGHATHLQPASSLEIQNTMLLVVDAETKNRLDSSKARLNVLESQIRPEGASCDSVENLRGSLLSLETKREEYEQKLAELKAAIQELESQDEEIALQIKNLSMQLVEEERSDDSRTKQLEQEFSETKEFVHYGNLVSDLAGIMKTYDKYIEKVTASKTRRTITDESIKKSCEINLEEGTSAEIVTEASVSRAMENYLCNVRKYVLKEAHCATKLRERLISNEAEESALRSEISQYRSVKGIGTMSTVISQIQKAIAEKQQIIRADNHRIATLTDDVRFMYDELLARLTTYQLKRTEQVGTIGASETNSTSLAALLPTKLLRDVPQALQLLGIVQSVDDLMPFMALDGLKPSIVTPAVVGGSPAGTAVASPVPTTAVPKFSWATSRAEREAATQEKFSLLEIQKEEIIRSSKESSENNSIE